MRADRTRKTPSPFPRTMATLPEIIRNRPHIKDEPLFGHHSTQYHWVYTRGDWEAGLQALMAAFPKETRTERPAAWFRLLEDTHWPGMIPPGNGPFFLPEYAVESGMEKILSKAHFKKVVAHSVMLPPDAEYLRVAMRAAGEHPWNADPVLYRGYTYPGLKGFKVKDLRTYTTRAWDPLSG